LLEGLSEGDALEDPHINVQMPTVCPTIEPVETAPTTKLECGGRPIDLIRRMVSDIQNEPFQPHYRRRRQGLPVRGWDQRLQSYFWPKPSSNWVIVCLEVDRILEDGYQIVEAVRNRAWTTEQKQQAKDWAHRVFKWRGVPQRDVTWETVWVVIQAALSRNELLLRP
jgi:hypothetical protein